MHDATNMNFRFSIYGFQTLERRWLLHVIYYQIHVLLFRAVPCGSLCSSPIHIAKRSGGPPGTFPPVQKSTHLFVLSVLEIGMELRSSSKCSAGAKSCLVAAKYAAVTVKHVVDEAASELVLTAGPPDGEIKGETAVLRYVDVFPLSVA